MHWFVMARAANIERMEANIERMDSPFPGRVSAAASSTAKLDSRRERRLNLAEAHGAHAMGAVVGLSCTRIGPPVQQLKEVTPDEGIGTPKALDTTLRLVPKGVTNPLGGTGAHRLAMEAVSAKILRQSSDDQERSERVRSSGRVHERIYVGIKIYVSSRFAGFKPLRIR